MFFRVETQAGEILGEKTRGPPPFWGDPDPTSRIFVSTAKFSRLPADDQRAAAQYRGLCQSAFCSSPSSVVLRSGRAGPEMIRYFSAHGNSKWPQTVEHAVAGGGFSIRRPMVRW